MSRKKSFPGDDGCILFVDDEESVREYLGELLTTCGFKVLFADSYKSAVSVLKGNEEIEAVLCDLDMPGESGFEVLRYVNKQKKHIPVIFLTGCGTLESCQEAIREGAFDYILKPLDNTDKAVLSLKHAIKEYRLERENKQMLIDILHRAEEHQRIIGDLLRDVETKEKVQKQISKILDKWKEDD